MKAAVIVKKGTPEKAFEIREVEYPKPQAHEVCIKVEAFGLNYADVMARLGLYADAPPLPAIVGYEVVGRIHEIGADVKDKKVGQRVVGMTRFGGYAEYAVTDARAVAEIPDDMDAGIATALATQYGTAYYAAEEMVRLQEGDHVLIHAAAGGVGTALVQLAKWRGCIVYGTAGSDEKLDYLRKQGVDYPINYRKSDFVTEIQKVVGERGLDVVFDSIGGDYIKKGMKLLGSGGRIVGYGAASMTGTNIFGKIKVALGFGFYSPISLLTQSKGIVCVNMLRIADNRPLVIKRCLENVVRMTREGTLNPVVGGEFKFEDIAKAHALLESRKSMGKIVIRM
jgi:NADPH:quinone reductase-like Zn-dependent oxidoreductase